MAPAAGHRGDPVPVLSRARDDELVLTLWTDDPALAIRAEAAGVDRIGPDLERVGKRDRQRGLGTWISSQRATPLAEIAARLTAAEPFVRVDPLGPDSKQQIERVLGLGAAVVMLPMFRSAAEVGEALELLAGRARLVPLVETGDALASVEELLALPEVSELHIGINDLALDLGMANRFQVLVDERVAAFCARVTAGGARLGIGGFGRVDDARLPLNPAHVLALTAGLGASAALLARTFCSRDLAGLGLARDVAALRAAFSAWRRAPAERLRTARERASAAIAALSRF